MGGAVSIHRFDLPRQFWNRGGEPSEPSEHVSMTMERDKRSIDEKEIAPRADQLATTQEPNDRAGHVQISCKDDPRQRFFKGSVLRIT